MPKVYFIGAGPGDPELLTLKGRRLLDQADAVIYAGSLVNPELLKGIKADIFDSAGMTLDETTEKIIQYHSAGKLVVRLHTGDTSFYSAITEQIDRLKVIGIDFEVVPGVSSASAAAAALGQELTIPEVSQTVILTRMEGRTPVPDDERLGLLAAHKASMVIFLSAGMAEKVQQELLSGYSPDTPVAVVEKASWPEQRIVRGRLSELPKLVMETGIKKTALIFVGAALAASESMLGKESMLYNKDFIHEYRNRK